MNKHISPFQNQHRQAIYLKGGSERSEGVGGARFPKTWYTINPAPSPLSCVHFPPNNMLLISENTLFTDRKQPNTTGKRPKKHPETISKMT